MAEIITLILSNTSVVLIVVALVVAFARVRGATGGAAPVSAAEIFWQELVFYGVGLAWLWYGTIHAFFQQIAAPSIGWQPSPFEFELGFGEIGVAVVAILSCWRSSDDMRLAVTIIFFVFSLAAAAQHIYFIVCCNNLAPNNAGIILWLDDIVMPVVLALLAWRAMSGRPRAET